MIYFPNINLNINYIYKRKNIIYYIINIKIINSLLLNLFSNCLFVNLSHEILKTF